MKFIASNCVYFFKYSSILESSNIISHGVKQHARPHAHGNLKPAQLNPTHVSRLPCFISRCTTQQAVNGVGPRKIVTCLGDKLIYCTVKLELVIIGFGYTIDIHIDYSIAFRLQMWCSSSETIIIFTCKRKCRK